MQPTTQQTVPATNSLPVQSGDRQPGASVPAPMPLDMDALRQVGGGQLPVTCW